MLPDVKVKRSDRGEYNYILKTTVLAKHQTKFKFDKDGLGLCKINLLSYEKNGKIILYTTK